MTQAQRGPRVEALSDEFGSTFYQPEPGILMNLFYEREQPTVEALIKKHLGATQVAFALTPTQFEDGYAMWLVRYR